MFYLSCLVSAPFVMLAAVFYRLWSKIFIKEVTIVPSLEVKKWVAGRSASKPKSADHYRQLFYKLQNLEDHADLLESARDELLAMFSSAVNISLKKSNKGILAVDRYSAESVERFMDGEQDRAMAEWNLYLQRRKQGQGPELFSSTEEAKQWVLKQAPVKYVDGAWLAHVHKITTPFALRTVTKNAWQVLSEELGDGDISKHHVHLYRELLKECGFELPEGYSKDYIDPKYWNGHENSEKWEAAVAQLLISLFPDEFLPEILGFNMHYELITEDTLLANHELKEMGVNPYYFLIHIVIDNADSGHTAMAAHTLTNYLDMIRATQGEAACQQAWKRAQVGYALSATAGGLSKDDGVQEQSQAQGMSLDRLSSRILEIFSAKASVSHQLHCQSRARIGGKTLAEWLSPEMWSVSRSEEQVQLLTALSQAKPWICPGASNKSLLMRELAWKGKMFGAFTQDETAALGAWIDALGPNGQSLRYWNYTGRDPLASKEAVGRLQDPVQHHPVIAPHDLREPGAAYSTSSTTSTNTKTLPVLTKSHLADVTALWFAHIGLLENTINTPARTADPIYANIIRVLRAQAGFEMEMPIVAGMDELRRLTCPSLVELGRELICNAGWGTDASVGSLQDVLDTAAAHGQSEESRRLAKDMLYWATRPSANLGFLVGLSSAFLDLKEAVARAPELLSHQSRIVLEAIVARERQGMEECMREIRQTNNEVHCEGISRGVRLGMSELRKICK